MGSPTKAWTITSKQEHGMVTIISVHPPGTEEVGEYRHMLETARPTRGHSYEIYCTEIVE